MVRRSATIRLDALTKTAEGYIDVVAPITRTGVFTYKNADGTEQLELRLPEHVFSAASLATFDGQPLTMDHPGLVTAESFRDHVVGVVMAPKQDGDHMSARIRVMDLGAVKAVEAGKRDLSNGYDTKLIPIPGGVFQREDYEGGAPVKAHFLQTEIVGNHTAIVSKGRAGTARLDSAGDELLAGETMDPKDIEIATLKAELEAFNKIKTDAEAAALAKVKADAAEAESLRAQLSVFQVADKARAHKSLVDKIVSIVKKDRAELEKMDDAALMRAYIAVAVPAMKTDALTGEALIGAFTAAQSLEATRVDSSIDAANIAGKVRTSDTEDAGEDDWRAEQKKAAAVSRDAWKTSLGPKAKSA